jgi:DNA-binding transcriptional LysR family regulator
MQFESLKVFCDVVRCRSFSQAAAANGVSQSAASQVVSQLEKRLGVQLINRGTRPLQLTPLGQVYYDGCKGLVERYTELEASLRSAQARVETTVQVAAIYSVGLGDMGQTVKRFCAQNPGVHVHLEYLHPDRVYEKVLDGSADLGLVSYPRRSRELEAVPWREEPMVLVLPPAHPLAAGPTVRPAQLDGGKYIGFDRGLVIRRAVDKFLRGQGVNVEVVLEFDNIENIKKAVEVGEGVALLPEPTVRREVRDGTLAARPLAGCRMSRPLAILYRRHAPPGSTARRFMDLLRHPGQAQGRPADTLTTSSQTNGTNRGRNGAARSPRKTGVA